MLILSSGETTKYLNNTLVLRNDEKFRIHGDCGRRGLVIIFITIVSMKTTVVKTCIKDMYFTSLGTSEPIFGSLKIKDI